MSSTVQVRPIEAQLGGDVPLLGGLRLLQRLVAAREVGAGVLPVAVEEQAVEPAVQIVVVRDVALRAGGRIVLVDAPLNSADSAGHSRPPDGRLAFATRLLTSTSSTS